MKQDLEAVKEKLVPQNGALCADLSEGRRQRSLRIKYGKLAADEQRKRAARQRHDSKRRRESMRVVGR